MGRLPLQSDGSGLEQLCSRSRGSPEICVAVLDGPVDLAHPSFRGADLTLVPTTVDAAGCAEPVSAHATHVASIIFGQPGGPVRGLAPRCRGLIVPIYGRGAGDRLSCSQLDLARAIELAVASGAHIINISGGEPSRDGEAEPLLAQAIRRCNDAGVLIVAAAGNDGCECIHLPAAAPTVLAVGAMDADGVPLAFSNFGYVYRTTGVLACGQDIEGALPGGGTGRRSGTSYATAVVSGVAALLLSLQVARGSDPDPLAVREAILSTADPCDPTLAECARFLAGRIRPLAADRRLAAGSRKENVMLEESIVSPPPAVQPSEVAASDCACGGGSTAAPEAGPPLVYALGEIGYDFGTEARRDSLLQQTGRNVHDPAELLAYFKEDPASAASVVWTLSVDATVVYAIAPDGPYASVAYERLRQFLAGQLGDGVERVSVPGVIRGSSTLLSGQKVPNLVPETRGMYSWSTVRLVQAVAGAKAGKEQRGGIQNFLERVYYEVRNLGVTSQERAMNHAATNAFQLDFVYGDTIRDGLKLDAIGVERSPLCRPGSDCWDVKLTFFHPAKRLEQARRVYRFTVDVSDVVPVTVGKVRNWEVY